MNNSFQKINKDGGIILGIFVTIFIAFMGTGYLQLSAILGSLMLLLFLTYDILRKKSNYILYSGFLIGSIMLSSIGVTTYQKYINNYNHLIGKIGFLILVGAFFVVSIIGIIISLYLIFNNLKNKIKKN